MALLEEPGLLLKRGEFNKAPVRDATNGEAILAMFLPSAFLYTQEKRGVYENNVAARG